MKKLVSMVLVALLIIASTLSVGADTTRQPQLFEDKFVEQHMTGHDGFVDDYMYNEFYYHYDENGQVDWVLVSAMSMMVQEWFINQVICDRVLMLNNEHIPFRFGYAVYDVKNDCFVELSDGMLDYYDGLREYWTNKKVGRLIGDADRDGELSVLDATYIQRALAKLCDFGDADIITGYDYSGMIKYISDFDRDGDRSVLDATAIQRRLALLDSESQTGINKLVINATGEEFNYTIAREMPATATAIEFESKANYQEFGRITHKMIINGTVEDFQAIIKSNEQFDKVFNEEATRYDDEFFDSKWLVVSLSRCHCHEAVAPISDLAIDGNTLYLRSNPYVPEPDMPSSPTTPLYMSIVAVDKDKLVNITDIVRVK